MPSPVFSCVHAARYLCISDNLNLCQLCLCRNLSTGSTGCVLALVFFSRYICLLVSANIQLSAFLVKFFYTAIVGYSQFRFIRVSMFHSSCSLISTNKASHVSVCPAFLFNPSHILSGTPLAQSTRILDINIF